MSLIDTVNWPGFVGSLATSSLATTETSAVSLSVMLTVAKFAAESIVSSESPAWMVVSATVTVSKFSRTESSMTVTSMVAESSPAEIVTIPEIGTKSVPASAEPVTS